MVKHTDVCEVKVKLCNDMRYISTQCQHGTYYERTPSVIHSAAERHRACCNRYVDPIYEFAVCEADMLNMILRGPRFSEQSKNRTKRKGK
jgi:hypothetical protein